MTKKLYRTQYCAMLTLFCMTCVFLPGIVARTAGRAAYLAFPLAFAAALLVVLMYTVVFRGERGLCTAAAHRLGKPLGKIVGLVYVLYFLLNAADLFCFYGLYISVDDSPLLFYAPLILSVMFAAAKGDTVLGRVAVIAAGLLLVLSLPLQLAGFFIGDLRRVAAVALAEPGTLLKVTLALTALEGGQTLAVTVISPPELRTAKNSLIAVSIGNAVVLLVALSTFLIDGQTPLINRVEFFSPVANGDLSELRIVAMIVLFFCSAFRISVCLRAACETAAEVLSLPAAEPLVPAFSVLLLGMGIGFSQNMSAVSEYLVCLTPYVSAVPLLGIPLLLWCFSGRRKSV